MPESLRRSCPWLNVEKNLRPRIEPTHKKLPPILSESLQAGVAARGKSKRLQICDILASVESTGCRADRGGADFFHGLPGVAALGLASQEDPLPVGLQRDAQLLFGLAVPVGRGHMLLLQVEGEAQAGRIDPTLADLAQAPYSPWLGQGLCDSRQACGVRDMQSAPFAPGMPRTRDRSGSLGRERADVR